MTTDVANGSLVALVSGVATGVVTFLGLMVWFGLPVIPSTTDLPTILKDRPSPYASSAAPAGPTDPGEQVYQSVCAACHQPTGQGLPGAFPPLAGSEFATGDADTMIRIVLGGVSGPLTVKGQKYNALMPPPPGLDDEKIAAVLTFVRSNFGNKSSKVDKAQVAALRPAVTARGKPWTEDELHALHKPDDGEKPAAAGEPGAPGAAETGAAAPGAAAPDAGTQPGKPTKQPAAAAPAKPQ